MEFWGVEVKSGQPHKVSPGLGMVLHLSQACLGESKKEKANDSVYLYVDVEGTKLVLGTLYVEKIPQQQFDLVFDKDFEISHNSKSSVYFYGYVASNPYDDEEPGDIDPLGDTESESESDDELPVPNEVKPEPKAKEEKKPAVVAKANAAAKGKGKESDAGKQKVKIVEPVKDDSDDSSDEDFMSEDESDSQEEDDDSDDSSEESEEETPKKETPKKAETSKKRPLESATKTPVTDKKSKVTPQKTDGKKASGHVATPHPAKQAKTPAANKPQTPKSAGTHSCTVCTRAFTSEQGLESHTKAKHSAGK